LSNYNI